MTFRRDVPATPLTPRAAIIQGNSSCSPEPMPDAHNRRMSSLVQVLMAQYLQSFFFWSQLIAIQAFSVLSSLSNLQPWRSCDLVVMVIILYCTSRLRRTILRITSFLIDRSERYPRSGAFPVGLLRNIYFRPFGGATLTAMVAGVLFLVPVRAEVMASYIFYLLW